MKQYEEMEQYCMECGAFKAKVIDTDRIPFDEELRKACEANICGHYGRNYACPPNVGTPGELIAEAKSYQKGLVFQTVTEIEDSYDIEGMMDAQNRHTEVADSIEKMVRKHYEKFLRLEAGGCTRCKVCGQITGEPCRMPDKATASVEAYCMNCSQLAEVSGMKYINGVNTVTYFGMFLLPATEIDF